MNFAGGKAEAIASALQSQAEAPDVNTKNKTDKFLTRLVLPTARIAVGDHDVRIS